jgi:hypothetical protein
MSQSGSGDASIQKRGWRGKRAAEPQHRWQKTTAAQSGQIVHGRRHWRWVRVIGLLVLFLALTALLIENLVVAPVQTPLVAVAATGYSWPFAPNAWAQEDLDSLAPLDNNTLSVVNISSAWQSKERGLLSLEQQLRDLARQGTKSNAVIVWISMHGALNDSGVPCLIPPGGSPWKSETWLPIPELLAIIKAQNLPSHWHKLLILDCNRMPVNWNLGVLANGFAERLPEAVTEANIPGLSVLNSTGTGQIGWASSNLRGSVFGHFLRSGMAGAADDPAEGGNGDLRVGLLELHGYLKKQVDAWGRQNRADHQSPILLPTNAADFEVTWALNKRAQRRLLSPDAVAEMAPSAMPAEKIAGLWRAYDQLQTANPYRFAPLLWHDMQHRLLWLEQANQSGKGYESTVRSLYADLEKTLAAIKPRADLVTVASDNQALGSLMHMSQPPAAYSLRMAEYLGRIDRAAAGRLRAALMHCQETPNPDSLAGVLTETPTGLPLLVDAQFVRLLQRDLAPRWWQHPEILSQALAVRGLGEEGAVPADERSLVWVQAALADADKLRRSAEDALFTDDEAALAGAGRRWQEAEDRYRQVQTLSAAVDEAIAVRDQAWAELPYLAVWLSRPLGIGQLPGPFDREINQVLLPLIDKAHALGHSLATSAPYKDGAPDTPPFLDLADDVRKQLEQLRQSFRHECAKLLAVKKPDANTLRDLDAALAVPLIPAPQRAELSRLQSQLQARFGPAETVSSAGDSSTTSTDVAIGSHESASYHSRIDGRWDEHPALAILNRAWLDGVAPAALDEKARSEPARFKGHIELGRNVRQLLASIPTQLRKYGDMQSPLQSSPVTQGSQAERLVRMAGCLAIPPLEQNPIDQRRRLDVQQLMFWQAQRALDDFWGPAEGQDVAWFDVAASGYLQTSRELADATPAIQSQYDRLSQELARRRLAARRGLLTSASDILLIDDSENADVQVAIQAGAEEAGRGLPTGQGVVYVTDAKGRLPSSTQELLLPLARQDESVQRVNFDYALKADALAGRGPILQAVALYRGNQFKVPFVLRPPGGVKIEYTRHIYGPPKITLHGRSRKRPSIVFILDCSDSMRRLTDVEGPEGNKQVSRLEVAKAALQGMLDRLAAQGDARVGVRFFGHRAGWNTKAPRQLLLQTEYARAIPDDLAPSEDVELVLPLGRFDQVVAGGVAELMKSVKPWGETPLYLALVEAEADFANEPADAEKSIVVITDGVNYQFNSPNPKTRADVLAANNRSLPIHLVGFQISESQAAEARREFGALATETQGSYVAATDATSLVKTLESLLGPSMYSVIGPQGDEVGRTEVGKTIPLQSPLVAETKYLVSLDTTSTEVDLFGGEGVELVLNRNGRSIQSVRYEQGSPEFGKLLKGLQGSPSGYVLGAHRPIGTPQGVRFPFSFQQEQQQFMPRPAECWIAVTPLLAGGKRGPRSYVFYDVNYEPGTPAPVLNWTALDWPATARQAEIRAWSKPTRSKSAKVLSLAEALQPPEAGKDYTVDGQPGIRIQVHARRGSNPGDPYRVGVIERHSADSPGIDALKVELNPPADRVLHRFDAEHGLVTHIFYLGHADEAILATAELRFTTRDEIQRGAWQLEEPLVIDVSAAGDVIRLVPAANTP